MIYMRLFFVFLSLFLLLGCSKNVTPAQKHIKLNQKAFEEEDKYILFALDAQRMKRYESAGKLFFELYKKSNKTEYLYKTLESYAVAKKFDKVLKIIDEPSVKNIKDSKLTRFKAFALLESKKPQQAKKIILDLLKVSKEVDNYMLLSDIYVKLKDYDMAIKSLESAYSKNYDEKVLDKMSVILYMNLDRKKDAIALLETHTRIHGCSRLICARLIGFYGDQANVDGLLNIYLKFYKIHKSDEIARRIMQIYGYKKDYIKLMEFLEDSGADDAILLELYKGVKDYKKASKLAQKLYSQTNNIIYLGQSAIFQYESAKNKNSKKLQKDVITKLKKVVKKTQDPFYLNYLGYLLIDHDLDIESGIKYVKQALKAKPNSVYYLDSLAWGYYKQKRCKQAYKLFKKIVKMKGGDDKEVIAHFKAVKKCMRK